MCESWWKRNNKNITGSVKCPEFRKTLSAIRKMKFIEINFKYYMLRLAYESEVEIVMISVPYRKLHGDAWITGSTNGAAI